MLTGWQLLVEVRLEHLPRLKQEEVENSARWSYIPLIKQLDYLNRKIIINVLFYLFFLLLSLRIIH